MRWLLIDRTAIGKAAYRRQTGGAPHRRPTSGYIMATVPLRASDFALNCADNKLMTIAFAAMRDLNEELGQQGLRSNYSWEDY